MKNDNSVAPLVPVVVNQDMKSMTFARFSPPTELFDPEAFDSWLDTEGGRDYLKLDPYTLDGLKRVLAFSEIDETSISWDQDLCLIYSDVLILVQNKGRPDDWTISAEEGFHRLTASIIRTLACKLDIYYGFVCPDTIDADHFDQHSVGKKTDIGGPAFRDLIYATTFNQVKPDDTRLITARVSYFKKGGLNGCEASYHLRGRSYATSVNKRRSVYRCPMDLMGEFMGNFMSNFTMDQATRRVHFDEINPNNLYKKEKKDYESELHKNHDDFNEAFPMASLLESDEYQSYLRDPFKEGTLDKVLELFRCKPIKGHFHVHKESEAYREIDDPGPEWIQPPFLPSPASNEIDVGNQFTKLSRFNPDTVNAAILAPTVYAYIMSAYADKLLDEVILDNTRIDHVNYYLRFHNSHGDCTLTKRVHAAYREKYRQTYDTKSFGICHKSTPMLGMLDFVLTIFNAYLSIEAEMVIEKKWEVREAHFKKMGLEFGSVFTNIGNTKAGRDYQSVIKVLGTIFYHWLIFFIS